MPVLRFKIAYLSSVFYFLFFSRPSSSSSLYFFSGLPFGHFLFIVSIPVFVSPPFLPGYFFPFRPMFHVPDGAGGYNNGCVCNEQHPSTVLVLAQ
ncbi:hypothetical protein HOY80DRAFT_700138 [Tuber brumale]|nr:hypothetical protein HOY80DRAFT_700138 [Tuber brumale]